MRVVADEDGTIISISATQEADARPSGIVELGVLPEEGQHVHNLDLSKELNGLSLAEIHDNYRIKSTKNGAEFMKLHNKDG